MTLHQLASTLFLVCGLIAFAGFARADVVECVGETGSRTFGDVPCKTGAHRAPASGAIEVASVRTKASPQAGKPVRIKTSSKGRNFVAAERARAAAWADKPKTNRRLALDVATLKAARFSIESMDYEAALVRQQALVRLRS